MNQPNDLKRTIGVWGLSANIINIVIGAGIFVLPALVAQHLGTSSILAYLCCGLLVGLVMLCFAEASSRVSESGGPYAIIEAAFGSFWGYLTACLFICSCIAADAAVSNALLDIWSSYSDLGENEVFRVTFFMLIFFGLAFINIIGTQKGIGLVKLNTIIKLAALIFIIVGGINHVDFENLKWTEIPSIQTISEATLLLFFAFQGAETGLAVSGEVIHPQKNIPKAIFISIGCILIIYISVQLVAQGVLGANLALQKENPLGDVAFVILGTSGLILIGLGAAFSMFGNISGEVLSMPRVLYGVTKNNPLLPRFLSLIHLKYQTPYISILVYTTLGFVFAVSGGFKSLAILSSSAILLLYLGIALSVLKLRKSNTTKPTFTIWGGKTIPILASCIIIGLLSTLDVSELTGILLLIGSFSLLYGVLYFMKKKR